mgnify:FL=1
MNAISLLSSLLSSSRDATLGYLADFSDAELLKRPVAGANHAAWQIGHLILSERFICGEITGFSYPDLPAGFAEAHGKDRASTDDTSGWLTRAGYEKLFRATREATLAGLAKLTEQDLGKATESRLKAKAPAHGNLLALLSQHDAMHGGQFSVIRRLLGKPVLF